MRAVAFVAGGLVSGGDDATVSLWDLPGGNERWRVSTADGVRALAASGDRIAVASGAHVPLRLLDTSGRTVARLAVPAELPHHVPRFALAFAADGSTLVSSTGSGRVDLWSATDGAHRATVRPCGETAAMPLAALPGGGFVVSCEGRALVALDDGLRGRRRVERSHPATALVPLRQDLVGLVSRQGGVTLFDLERAVPRTDHPSTYAHEGVESATLSADRRLLALGLGNGAAVVVDLASGQRVHAFEGLGSAVLDVAFSADGRQLAAALFDHRASVFSLEGGSVKASHGPPIAAPGAISALAFAADGHLFAASSAGQLREWRPGGGLAGQRNLAGSVSDLMTLEGNRLLAVIGDRSFHAEERKRRLVVQDRSGAPAREVVLPAATRGLVLDPGRVITGGPGRLDLWGLAGEPRASWPLAGASEWPLAIATDGGALVTLRDAERGGRATLVLREGRGGQELARLSSRGGGAAPRPCSGGRHDHLIFEGRLMRVVGGPRPDLVERGAVSGDACSVSPDGRLLAVRERSWANDESASRVLVLAVPEPPSPGQSLKVLAALTGHRGPVTALAFSADGRRLATGGADGTVLDWEIETALKTSTAPRPEAEAPWEFGLDDGGLVTAPGAALEVIAGVDGRALAVGSPLRLEGATPGSREWTFAGWFAVLERSPSAVPQRLFGSRGASLEVAANASPSLVLGLEGGASAHVSLHPWTGPWTPGTWHHVAIVQGARGTRICVDAICGEAPPLGARAAGQFEPLELGPRPGQDPGRVAVDALRIHARALGDAELAAEARTTHVRPLSTPTPLPQRAAAALEATPEPIVPADASRLVSREVQPDFEVLRFTGPMAALELFDVEVGGGRVWVATSRGLLEHDPARGMWRLHGRAAGLPGERLTQIAWVAGRVVVAASEVTRPGVAELRGIHAFDPTVDRFSPLEIGSPSVWELSGEGDSLWIGRGSGAEARALAPLGKPLLEASPVRSFTRAAGQLQHQDVYRILVRPESVWFTSMGEFVRDADGKDGAFVGGGLAMWDRAADRFHRWGVEAGLADGYGAAIAADEREAWLTHFRDERGVSRLDRASGRWQAFHQSSNGERLGGIAIALTPRHAWIGSQRGLLRVDRDTMAARRYGEGLPGHILYGIAEGFGALWVTVYGTSSRGAEGWRTQAGLVRIPLAR